MDTISAYVTGERKIEFVKETLPPLGPHDILIRTDSVGLCHTDLPVFNYKQTFGISERGYRENQYITKPQKLGHEPVGTVADVGSAVTKFAVGDHVSGNYPQAFTTYRVVCDDTPLVKLPPMGIDYRYCVVEPMGCVVNILHYLKDTALDNVGVIGCGYMNLMVISALKNIGAKKIFAVDINDDKLTVAQKYGADVALNSTKENIVERVYNETNGKFLDSVIEMSGSIKGLQSACSIVKFAKVNGLATGNYNGRGKIIITSVYSGEEVFPKELAYELVLRCPILDAAHPMSGVSVEENDKQAADLFMQGVLPMNEMVTHTIHFSQLQEALGWLVSPPEGYVKGIVLFD